jgi:hypothetical protein
MNITKIIELDIDISAMIKSASEVKKKIDELNKVQKTLKKEGDTSSQQFVQNASDLKNLNKSYQGSISAIAERTQAIADAEVKEKLMTLALKSEVKSIEEARNQNKLLNKLRNETNISTKEGKEQLELLNKKLDENNEFIKENSDAYARQKINIGNYKDGIKDAFKELNIFNGGFTGFIQRSKDAGGVSKLVTSSLKGMKAGIIGITKASLAFLATPIGAVIGVLAGLFLLVKNAMNRSETATNKIRKALSGFTGIIKGLMKFLEPLGEFLIDGLMTGFELVQKGIFKAMKAIAAGLAFLGFDEAATSLRNFTNEIEETSKASQQLIEAEIKLEKVQREAQRTQLEYQKKAEKLRQIRDDETLTIKERIQANEDLSEVLKQQLKAELAIAKQALRVAQLRIKADGETKETLDAQAEALTRISDIQERITGQESEQLTNKVALQKEAYQKIEELRKKAIDNAIKESKTLLDIYIAEQGVKAKTLKEELRFTESVVKKKKDILRAELKAKKITQLEYNLAILELDNDLVKKRANIAVDNAARELQLFKDIHQSKLDANTFFTEELLNQETKRLDAIAEKERKYHKKRLEEGVINQQQYYDAIDAIDKENRKAKEEARLEREQAKKEQQEVDLVNEQEVKYQNISNDFDREFQVQQSNLDRQRKQELKAAEKSGADINKINKKYDNLDKQLAKEKANAKLSIAGQTFGMLADLIGRESGAGKALAIGQATINTYLGATKALATLPPPFGAIQAGITVATGLAQVAKISGIGFEKPQKPSLPKAEKGAVFNIGGNRHSSGGTKFYGEDGTAFEAEQGEKLIVLNRASSAMLPLLSDINQQYGGASLYQSKMHLATGGQILRGSGISQQPTRQSIDTNEIKEAIYEGSRQGISEANLSVAVEDINTGQGNYAEVVNGANLGG